MSFCEECQQTVMTDVSFHTMCALTLGCRVCQGKSLNAKSIVQSFFTCLGAEEEDEDGLTLLTAASETAVDMDVDMLRAQLQDLKTRERDALTVWRKAASAEKNARAVSEAVRRIKNKLERTLGNARV